MSKRCLAGAILMLLLPVAAPRPRAVQTGRPFTVADFLKLKTITSTALSPDGSRVLYTVKELDVVSNSIRRSVWTIRVSDQTRTKLDEEALPNSTAPPAWSPDGTQVAFVSAREGGNQVWLVGARGGEAARLTSGPADVQSFAWSPDGKRLAFIMAEHPAAPPPQETPGVRLVGTAAPGPLSQIYLVELGTKEVRRLTKGDIGPDALSWSPDGKQIAFSAQGDIHVVALADGESKKLVERAGPDINPIWSPDGRQIAFFTSYGDSGGPKGLSVVAAGGGAPRDIFRNFDPGFGGYPPRFVGWSSDGKTLYASGLSRMTQGLYALSTETGEAGQITPPGPRVYHDFSFSRDTRTLSFVSTDPHTPGEIFVSPVSEFKPVQLTRDTNPHLAGVSLGEAEAVRWKSKDGLEVEGLLVKPVGYERGRRYPLLVLMQGTYGTFDLSFTGRVSADSPDAVFPFQQQVFAGQGYVVLMPNPRGSWGYGEEFRRRGRTDYGAGPYADIITGVEHLISQGVADGERLGIMGIGFDGYRAAFAITQTDRFKAASIGYPFGINLVSWYGQAGPGFVERYFGGPPWEMPQNYASISPINFAKNLKTPTLLFHTDEPAGSWLRWVEPQTQELYTALQKNNVPVEYAIYRGADGIRTEPKLLADLIRRNLDWFNRWIKR